MLLKRNNKSNQRTVNWVHCNFFFFDVSVTEAKWVEGSLTHGFVRREVVEGMA